MLTYRNTKTGAVITVPCPVSGEWELVEEPKAEPTEETAVAEAVEEPKVEKPKRRRTTKK